MHGWDIYVNFHTIISHTHKANPSPSELAATLPTMTQKDGPCNVSQSQQSKGILIL